MASASPLPQLQNVYHLRTVADTSAKSCMVCYKPSTSVLITPDNKDFFYICRGHLKDRGFATAIIDEAEAASRKRQQELDKEIEIIKKEYEEKMKNKKAKKGKDKEKEKEKDKKAEDDEETQKLEKEKDEKIKAANSASGKTDTGTGTAIASTASAGEEENIPRIYALHRNFFQMRLDRIRNAEIAKRNRERLSNPTSFPNVPSGNP